jgi:hypothetical protein
VQPQPKDRSGGSCCLGHFKSGPGYQGSGSSQDFWSYDAQVSISQDGQWDAITELRIDPRQPGLNDPG